MDYFNILQGGMTGSLSEVSLQDHLSSPALCPFLNEITEQQLVRLFLCICLVGFVLVGIQVYCKSVKL